MAGKKTKRPDPSTGVPSPSPALQLMAPPVRLVSAALLKVLKQRDFLKYGMVEEFVSEACDAVPGLLTIRHQGKLLLGLRARMILELCRTQPDAAIIKAHLKRIRAPAVPSCSSAPPVMPDLLCEEAAEGFRQTVSLFLTNPAEREKFFREEFPVEYGAKFDQDLEKLMWEFLVRLEQLLPTPSLAETASWLSGSPDVQEACARSATQPQLLNLLLQHQRLLCDFEPPEAPLPNLGDSILGSLSLPPSGKPLPKPPTGATTTSAAETSTSSTQTRQSKPFVKAAIARKVVPVTISAGKRAPTADVACGKEAVTNNRKFPVANTGQKTREEALKVESIVSKSRGVKRKQPEQVQSEVEEDGDVPDEGQEMQGPGVQNASGSGGKMAAGEELAACLYHQGLEKLRLPEDPYLRSIFVSCLRRQPRVVVQKLRPKTNRIRLGGRYFLKDPWSVKKLPFKAGEHRAKGKHGETTQSGVPGLNDKENDPSSPSLGSSPAQLQTNTGAVTSPPANNNNDDYVADSEDEATKNFKCRLFIKRYFKTKHGTYVPTLREYWKPRAPRPEPLSAGSKHR